MGLRRAIVGVTVELFKLIREMLVIPAQLWMLAAERAGAAVLAVWERLITPVFRAAWAALVALYEAALREITPARAVAATAVAALIALAAGQWLDLSNITVGNDAYAPGVEAVAPAPAVETERVGEAHAWLMIPLALAGLGLVAAAFRRRASIARLLVLVGIAVVAVALAVDAPQGLDEGIAASAYQGAEAQLLEGFWVEIACGAVLIAAGLLLPRYITARRLLGSSSGTTEARPRRERDWRLPDEIRGTT